MVESINKLSLVLILLLFQAPEHPKSENEWSDYLVSEKLVSGEREYVLPDGRRVDVFGNGVAYEVDWATKWPEGVGQALGYAVSTNTEPGLIMLIKKGNDEYYNAAIAVVTDLRRRGYIFHFIVVDTESGKIWKL